MSITWETFFLKNHTLNVVEKLFPGHFLKNHYWAYLWINIPRFIYFVSIVCQVEEYRKSLKLNCWPFAFTSYMAFSKNKKRSCTSLSASFSAWFLKKNTFVVIFYYLTKFECLVAFTSWDIGQYMYCNCSLTGLWRQKFWS